MNFFIQTKSEQTKISEFIDNQQHKDIMNINNNNSNDSNNSNGDVFDRPSSNDIKLYQRECLVHVLELSYAILDIKNGCCIEKLPIGVRVLINDKNITEIRDFEEIINNVGVYNERIYSVCMAAISGIKKNEIKKNETTGICIRCNKYMECIRERLIKLTTEMTLFSVLPLLSSAEEDSVLLDSLPSDNKETKNDETMSLGGLLSSDDFVSGCCHYDDLNDGLDTLLFSSPSSSSPPPPPRPSHLLQIAPVVSPSPRNGVKRKIEAPKGPIKRTRLSKEDEKAVEKLDMDGFLSYLTTKKNGKILRGQTIDAYVRHFRQIVRRMRSDFNIPVETHDFTSIDENLMAKIMSVDCKNAKKSAYQHYVKYARKSRNNINNPAVTNRVVIDLTTE